MKKIFYQRFLIYFRSTQKITLFFAFSLIMNTSCGNDLIRQQHYKTEEQETQNSTSQETLTGDLAVSDQGLFPCNLTINNRDLITTNQKVQIRLSTSQNRLIARYQLSTTSVLRKEEPWSSVATPQSQLDISFTLLSGNGIKTIYGWCQDRENKISRMGSDSIGLQSQTKSARIWNLMPLKSENMLQSGRFGGEAMQMIHGYSFSPSNRNILYFVNDTGGVFKSADGGDHWESKRNGFKPNGGISIGVDPRNENVVFVTASLHTNNSLTSPVDGIYRSLDGGDSWSLVKPTPYYRNKEGQHFAFDPTSFKDNRHQIIYAASHTEGLLRSVNGGETWQTISSSKPKILDLELRKDGSATILYVATNDTSANNHGLYKVIDYQQQITITPLGNLPDYPRTIAVKLGDTPSQDTIYAAIGTHKIFKSIDGGKTFLSKSQGLNIEQVEYTQVELASVNRSTDLNSSSSDWLYLKINEAGRTLFFSHNGGETWQYPQTFDPENLLIKPSDGFFGTPILPHPSNRNIAWTHLQADNFLKTTDGGVTWSYAGSGYCGSRRGSSFSSYFDPKQPEKIIFFLVDHGPFVSTNSGDSWASLFNDTVTGSHSTPLGAVDPSNSNIILAAVGAGQTRIIRTENGGITWQTVNPVLDNYRYLAFHSQNTNIVYAGGSRDGWISKDRGRTWVRIPGRSIIGTLRSDNNIIYSFAPSSGGITFFRSSNQGSSWVQHSTLSISDFEDFQVDPHNLGRLFVATDGGLYRFDGSTWREVGRSAGLHTEFFGNRTSLSIKNIAIDPNHPGVVYAGLWAPSLGHREHFIYRSTDGGTTWTDIRYNLTGFSRAWGLTINPNNSEVHLSTDHGNFILPSP